MTTQLNELIDEFFLARMPKKHSPHTLAAYRRDFDTISAQLVAVLGTDVDRISIDQLDVKTLRRAFAAIAHQSAASISRTWSTWNQLFTFLVAEGTVAGNPMAAVDKPRVPKSRPKAITGDDSVKRLLEVAARGRTGARDPWPERDFAVVVTLLTCGLRLSELLDLTLRSIDGPRGERVVGVRGKGNKERTVPLEPEVEAMSVPNIVYTTDSGDAYRAGMKTWFEIMQEVGQFEGSLQEATWEESFELGHDLSLYEEAIR